ncbi:unnamed protein product [Polarella glacialis]|uniref:UDP-glucuronosyltransferase n=1 Tax=Polarella glacialis TaxID=89957 RepID=A0A813LXF7_POLGL|nr:unnamed protein product [Polarella glacialis]
MVSFPLSPLHGVVEIGQELCLRGHNVTVLSFGERGRSKTKKYSPKCPLNYVSMGPLPVSDAAEQEILAEMALTNSTLKQIRSAAGGLFSAYISSVRKPLTQIMASGIVKPHFALVSVPMGIVGEVLLDHGVDFAVNMPNAVLPLIIPWAAPYIPIPFYHVSVHGMTLLDRLIVIGGSHVFQLAKHIAAALGAKFYYIPDLNPALWRGRLVLVNNIPGLDYPQPLPPLVQYTGPLTDLAKMEKFPPEVEAWLKTVPEGSPIVYVSFGTVAYLARERVQAMVATLTSAHYHVLWALPKSQQVGLPATMPSSMHVHHWIPTPRALAHPKVVAFISHCGGNSVSESMAMGVPIIGYPQFGDQPAVCQRVADAGAGVVGATGGWVQANEVLEVVTNPAYAKRAQSIARLFKGFGGVSKAADLLEMGAKGDLALLQTPTDRSLKAWFLLNGYDLLLLAVLASHLVIFTWARCCRRCCSGRPGKGRPSDSQPKEKSQ